MDNQPEQPEPPRSSADYANYSPPEKKSKMPKAPSFNWRKPAKYLLVLVILAAIGAGIYAFVLKPKPETYKPATQSDTSQTNQPQSGQITTATENYSSQEFALSFDYPEDWTVTSEPGSGRLTATSPDLQLTDQDGRNVTGQITLTIRNKQQALPEFDAGNSIAARDSEKINYTKPSQNQRGSTYLSFLRYASSANAEGDFDGIYITGDTGYQKDQAVPKADFTPVDPIISVTFSKGSEPLTVADNIWDNPNYSTPIRGMLESLVIN